jgi:hypothetical protein
MLKVFEHVAPQIIAHGVSVPFRSLARGCRRFGSLSSTLRSLCTQQRCSRVSG